MPRSLNAQKNISLETEFSESHERGKRIIVCGGVAESLTNFRGPLIKSLLNSGYSVTAMAGNEDPRTTRILNEWGADFVRVPIHRARMNPISEMKNIVGLSRTFAALNADVFLGYTVKPATFGILAAHMAGIRRKIALITGLGYAFTEGKEFRRKVANIGAKLAYKIALKAADAAIFQNPDDEQHFYDLRLLPSRLHSTRVNGSGVDTERFAPVPLPKGPLTFLMIARLLRDKGTYEFADAARQIKRTNPEVRFLLVGPLDPNPSAIQAGEIAEWHREGILEYLGEMADVRPAIEQCHVYVLPSYREGTPRTVLEAMAMRRPIITTSAPGCKETVIDGRNGFLVSARSSASLEIAMRTFLNNQGLIAPMAEESLKLCKHKFDAEHVARNIVSIISGQANALQSVPSATRFATPS